jgi:hypothetical protein
MARLHRLGDLLLERLRQMLRGVIDQVLNVLVAFERVRSGDRVPA